MSRGARVISQNGHLMENQEAGDARITGSVNVRGHLRNASAGLCSYLRNEQTGGKGDPLWVTYHGDGMRVFLDEGAECRGS